MSKIVTFLHFRVLAKLTSCLLLVALADFLFYGEKLGWTLGLFGGFLLLASVAHNFKKVFAHPSPVIALSVSGALAVAMVDNLSLFTACMFVLSAGAFALLSFEPCIGNIRKVFTYSLRAFLFAMFKVVGLSSRLEKRRLRTRNKSGAFVRHWLMPSALFGLFSLLFAEANPVFTRWFAAINWAAILDYISFLRMWFWFVVGSVCWTIVRPRFKVRKELAQRFDLVRNPPSYTAMLFNERSIKTALILFNLLFALQNGMDFAILWSGVALPQGVTFAQYAHQGAYPLIFTAMLAAVFVLIALKQGSVTEHVPLIRGLVYVWVGQNIFLVASSMIRLCGYIGEFSLTHLRLCALIWMGLVGVGLVLIIARAYLEKSNLWLINANGIALFAVLFLSCFVNSGGIIADYNVRHCNEVNGTGPSLDAGYLYELGAEALPAMYWYEKNCHNCDNAFALHSPGAFCTQCQAVPDGINSLREKLVVTQEDWRQWTFRNYRIYREIHNAS